MARGRDAADVAMTTTFGVNQLQTFRVWTDEVQEDFLQLSVATPWQRWSTHDLLPGDHDA